MTTSNQEIAAFADQLPVGVLVLGAGFDVQAINALALGLLDIQIESLLSPNWLEEVPIAAELKNALVSSMNDQTNRQSLVIEIAGRPVKCTITSSPDRGEGERRVIAVLEDATELRRLEAVKRDFIGSVLHRLRSPLSTLKTSLAILTGMSADQLALSGKEVLDMGYAEVNRLHVLVEDLRDLFYIETGLAHKELELESFQIAEVLTKAVMEVGRLSTPYNRIERQLQIRGAQRACAIADFTRLKQVFVNLLKNACIFSPDGGPIDIDVEQEGGQVMVRIIDHGIGVADDKRALLFTKFFREDNRVTRISAGNGLGLFTAKSYVELMGGTISAESRQGVGTTMIIGLLSGEGTIND